MVCGDWANVSRPMHPRQNCNRSLREARPTAATWAATKADLSVHLRCRSLNTEMPASLSWIRKANVLLCAARFALQTSVSAHLRSAIVKIQLGSSSYNPCPAVNLAGHVPRRLFRSAQRSLVFARQRRASVRTLPTRKSKVTQQKHLCGHVGLADHKKARHQMAPSVVGLLPPSWPCSSLVLEEAWPSDVGARGRTLRCQCTRGKEAAKPQASRGCHGQSVWL